MLKKAGVWVSLTALVASFVFLGGVKVRAATLPASMTAPQADTTYSIIPIEFTLGENPLTGSMHLIFTGSTTIDISLAVASPATGPYSFTINPTNIAASGPAIDSISPSTNVLPDDTYTVSLSYRNGAGDPAYTTMASNVRVDTTAIDSDGDGVQDAIESAAPNDGDANDDGTADSQQANVIAYLNPVSNHYAVLATTCNSIEGFEIGSEYSENPDVAYNYPFGLAGFNIHCDNPGDTATIRQYYYGVNGNDTYKIRKWSNGSYREIPNGQLLGQPIGEDVVFLIEYQITDGGSFDDDSAANAVIVDPSGAALADITTTPSGNSSARNLAVTGQSKAKFQQVTAATAFISSLLLTLALRRPKRITDTYRLFR
jgi:hypothetical protein